MKINQQLFNQQVKNNPALKYRVSQFVKDCDGFDLNNLRAFRLAFDKLDLEEIKTEYFTAIIRTEDLYVTAISCNKFIANLKDVFEIEGKEINGTEYANQFVEACKEALNN